MINAVLLTRFGTRVLNVIRIRKYSDGPVTIKPSELEKRILVWTKRYPSMKEIPERVPSSAVLNAKDRFRWKLAVIAMGLTVLGSCYMVYLGKRSAQQGDTLLRRGLDWHEELRPGSTKAR